MFLVPTYPQHVNPFMYATFTQAFPPYNFLHKKLHECETFSGQVQPKKY